MLRPIPSSTAQYPGGKRSVLEHPRFPTAGSPWAKLRVGFRNCAHSKSLLGVYSRCGLMWLLSSPRRPFVIGVLTDGCSSTSAPLLPTGATFCELWAGFAPAEDWRLLTAHVESTTGAVAVGRGGSCSRRLSPMPVPHSSPWLRFQSPLVEPDMQISRIRLSDEIMPSHVAPSGFAELHLRLIGFRQSSCSFLRHALLSN